MQYLDPIVTPDHPDIDIVFVHGLNPNGIETHARQTWTDDGGVFWPDILLRQDLPSARVLLFAYNSSILSNASSAHVASHARTLCDRLMNRRREAQEIHRPLLFVAHSLGGLLVKQALVEARIDPLYKCLKASTCGLVFFATPHRGGEGAGVAKAAADICSAFTGQPRNKLLESLKSKSLITELSSDQFRHQLDDFEVLSLIERRKMPVKIHRFIPRTNMFIVDATSAKLGSARENFQDVDRNHSDICKFSGLHDHAYEGVGPNLKAMADRARQRQIQCEHTQGPNSEPRMAVPFPYASRVPGSIPSHLAFQHRNLRVNLPKLCNPFIGRDSLVQDIHEELQGSMPQPILLSGLGGVGKTELSISVVEKLSSRGYVLWLRASDDGVLEQDIIKAAEELRHELLRFDASNDISTREDRRASAFYFSPVSVTDLVTILRRWLKAIPDGNQRTLVILDDLDGLNPVHHEKYRLMFAGDAVDVIYTARDPSMADLSMLWQAINFDVPSLQVDEAVKLLELLAQSNRPTRKPLSASSIIMRPPKVELDNVMKWQMENVAKCLGALPAAIATGSHYMKDSLGSRWDPDSYGKFVWSWNHDDGKRSILQSHRATLKYRDSVLASFEVSLQRLRRNIENIASHDTLEENCLRLLRLLSAMDVNEISRRDLLDLKGALPIALSDLLNIPHPLLQFSELVTTMLTHGFGLSIDQCLTELIKVSLLTERSSDRTLLLNSVTKACALLVPMTISSDEKAALEVIAKEVQGHWTRKAVDLSNDDLEEP